MIIACCAHQYILVWIQIRFLDEFEVDQNPKTTQFAVNSYGQTMYLFGEIPLNFGSMEHQGTSLSIRAKNLTNMARKQQSAHHTILSSELSDMHKSFLGDSLSTPSIEKERQKYNRMK